MRELFCIIILFATIGHAQVWQQLPSFPGTPRDDAASFVIGDHIYVGTGMEVGWGLTNDWYRFDMTNETWEPIASLPASPRQYCSGFASSNTGYLFGGIDSDGALNELWAYDPAMDIWTARAPLPAEARYACATSGLGSAYGIIATGMLASGVATNEVWRYLFSGDTWSPMAPVPGPHRHRAAGYLGNDGFTVAGGADDDFNALDDVWNYSLPFENGEWQEYPSLPFPRYGLRGVGGYAPLNLLHDHVVLGGSSATASFHDNVWQFIGSEWIDLPTFTPGPRRGGVISEKMSTEPNVRIVFFGLGLHQHGPDEFERSNDWWKLTYPVGIADHDGTSFTLFPNPAHDRITLQLSDQWTNGTVSIHDALGRTIRQLSLPGDRMIDVHDLAPGRYEVFISTGDQRTLRAPLIKLE